MLWHIKYYHLLGIVDCDGKLVLVAMVSQSKCFGILNNITYLVLWTVMASSYWLLW